MRFHNISGRGRPWRTSDSSEAANPPYLFTLVGPFGDLMNLDVEDILLRALLSLHLELLIHHGGLGTFDLVRGWAPPHLNL